MIHYVIAGSRTKCYSGLYDPLVHARGFCCNSNKSEVW